MIVTETWKDIAGHEGRYAVSNRGRVRNIFGAIKAQRYDKYGYPRLNLFKGDKTKLEIRHVHALVAESFIGSRPEGREVNHKNGIKDDNRLENLEYVTRSENIRHAFAMGLKKKGHMAGSKKVSYSLEQVLKGLQLHCRGFAWTECERRTGVNRQYLSRTRRFGLHGIHRNQLIPAYPGM